MIDPNIISNRLKALKEAFGNLDADAIDMVWYDALQNHIHRSDSLLNHISHTCHGKESDAHPLGCHPFKAADLLYHLDRCEELIHALMDDNPPSINASSPVRTLLYPTIAEAILGFIFAIVSNLKGRLYRYRVKCDSPSLREIMFLYCPRGVEPVVRRLLPRKRPDWSYNPDNSR